MSVYLHGPFATQRERDIMIEVLGGSDNTEICDCPKCTKEGKRITRLPVHKGEESYMKLYAPGSTKAATGWWIGARNVEL